MGLSDNVLIFISFGAGYCFMCGIIILFIKYWPIRFPNDRNQRPIMRFLDKMVNSGEK